MDVDLSYSYLQWSPVYHLTGVDAVYGGGGGGGGSRVPGGPASQEQHEDVKCGLRS